MPPHPSRRGMLRAAAAGLATSSATSFAAAPADPPAARPADVATLDGILAALYGVISGAKGEPRDWDRFRSLFAPGARLIPCVPSGDGGASSLRVLTPEAFAEQAGAAVATRGFYETEVRRRVDRFGHIAHVFSTYESREAPDRAPFQRGINSIQLFWDDARWWVVTIFWDAEAPGRPIPREYLDGP